MVTAQLQNWTSELCGRLELEVFDLTLLYALQIKCFASLVRSEPSGALGQVSDNS